MIILGKITSQVWRKKVITSATKWAAEACKNTLGDEKLRIYIAELLSKGTLHDRLVLTADKQYYEAETHYIAACSLGESAAPAFAHMLLEWTISYSASIAQTDPTNPSADSVERVLAGTFALRGWIPYVSEAIDLLSLLINRAVSSARTFLNTFIQDMIKRHPNLLLPIKPNPCEYHSPAQISTYRSELYKTASPALNFSQTAIALVADVESMSGRAPEEMRAGWQALVRQFVQDGGMKGMEASLYEVSNFIVLLTTAAFTNFLYLLWIGTAASSNGHALEHVFIFHGRRAAGRFGQDGCYD